MAVDDPVSMPTGLLKSTALREPEPEKAPLPESIEVSIANDNGVSIDPASGALLIEGDDGSVVIDLSPNSRGGFFEDNAEEDDDFDVNLAERLDESELGRISEELLRGIQFDEQSRKEWLETRAEGIRLLGLVLKSPRATLDTAAAMEGMSTIMHPLLLEATLRFQANARGELLPSDGPVKVADKLTETGETNEQAEALEKGMNYYLTDIATEYYPDTDRLLLFTGFGGTMFKKVYNCPLRQRPVSESVDAKDLIVSDASTDMRNSGRVTHQIKMRPSVLKRMQLAGAYRDVPIYDPVGVVPNAVDREIADVQGVQPIAQQTEDRDHTIYECYCELDIRGYEHEKDGEITGLRLPYRVVIDKDSQQVLEVRRNWKEDDETYTAKMCFVKYSFVPGLGFYDIGLVNILGNTTNALTASWREMLDAGMFANFPGFVYSKDFGRQNTNEFRVPPGGGVGVDIPPGTDIRAAIMALPYKDISPAFAQFIKEIAETGQRLGGTAEVQIAEGRQDAPVGTTLALIEQAGKVEGAVHKRLHAAQSQEFQMLKECFRENPQAFLRAMAQKGDTNWDEAKFLAALNDASIVPQADPNTPSHMHRLMKAMALIQLDQAYPGLMDPKLILKRVGKMAGIDDIDGLLKPEGDQAGIPPEIMLKLKELADKEQERASKAALQQAADASEARQQAHEAAMQRNESNDQRMQVATQIQLGQLDFAAANRTAQADVTQEQLRLRAAEVESAADVEAARIQAKADAKAAESSVKVAAHGVTEAKHKATGDAAKAKAAAKKPAPKK